MRTAFLLPLGLAVLFAQTGGQAQATDALPYSTGYLLTGDYVVGSIDLVSGNATKNDLSAGTIPMSGVPANADILAAFLYWETIQPSSVDPRHIADSVRFRGRPIKSVRVKSKGQLLTGNTGQCFASGSRSSLRLTMFRADVLRLLPPQLDVNGKSTGKLLVNDADLTSNNLPLHIVTLPEVGRGNVVPDSAGASLVVVYRDPALPLRKIVLYDGLHIATRGEVTTQTIGGFYQSDTSKNAKITHIAGSGASNPTEVLWFNNSAVASNPFPDSSKSSDRSWGHVTVDVSSLMTRAVTSSVYGETVTSRVTHGKDTPYECPTWAATIFSTTVLDADHDGIPDRLEQPGGPLKDPNDVMLPDLYAMGARSDHKDFFAEVNAMRTVQDTTYGSAAAPYDSSATPPVESVTAPPHNHMPISEVIRRVGDALKGSPVLNPDGTTGIRAHVDVGDIGAYHALGADYAPGVGLDDVYLVPSALARGGELTTETACDPAQPTCRFPDYPGTVGWGFSLTQYMLDKFDKDRNGLFHYLLYAHSRGKAKSTDPESTDFHVPSSSSGVSDLPGHRAVVSLGRWENFVGTPFIAASTTFHEIGHQWELYHGGAKPTITTGEEGIQKFVEPNCKPNYPSAMSYALQLLGQLDDAGKVHLNLSGATHDLLDENALSDVSLNPIPQYRSAWYSPLVPGSLGAILGTPAAKKLCNGLVFPPGYPPVPMGRLVAESAAAALDWDALGFLPGSIAQDVNLDGTVSDSLRGFNDWANIRLDQIGGGHLMGDVSTGGQDFGGQDFGGQDFGGQDFGGQDFGGQDFGGQDFGGQDFGGLDFDGQDFGGQDFGGQDFGGDGELTQEDAEALVGAAGSWPIEFTACVLGGELPAPRAGVGTPACEGGSSPLHRTKVTWKASTFGTPVRYRIIRATGATVTDDNQVVVGTPTPADAGCSAHGQLCSFVDTEELPDGQQFTYFAKAEFGDGSISGASDRAAITARNDAPVAIADARSTNEDTPFTGTLLGASHVLVNDSDADSPTLTPSLIAGTTNGTLVFNADGTFTYTPNGDFYGTDSFSYKLLGGTWPRDSNVPLSADSAIATVTMTVNPVNDAPSFTKGADRTVFEDAGLQTVAGWATNISAGPLNETDGLCEPLDLAVCSQTVSFLVDNNNGALFSAPPAIAADGTLTYTPAPNANGSAVVTVQIHDDGGTDFGGIDTSAAQTFTITVTEVNGPPVAAADSKMTAEDTTLIFDATDLVANDSAGPDDEAGQTLTVISVTATADTHGQVSLTGGVIEYVPDDDYEGPATFDYTVEDNGTTNGQEDPRSAVGHVDVTVTEVNDPPVAVDDSTSTTENTPRVFPATDLTANDSPGPANETLQILTVTEVGSPVNGSAVLENGTITFTPATNFDGQASFVYTACDNGTTNGASQPECASATVAVTVQALSGRFAVVVNTISDTTTVIDLQTSTVTTTLPTGSSPIGASVTPDDQLGVVADFSGSGTLYLINLAVDPATSAGTFSSDPFIPFPESTAITPDGRYAIVADGGGETDAVSVDLQSLTVVSTVSGLPGNQAVAITPDGTEALVLGANANIVSVLTISPDGVLADTGQRLGLAGVANGPRSIAITPNGRLALVTDSSRSLVSILQSIHGTWTLAGSIGNLGTLTTFNTSGIAITPDGSKAYVSNFEDSTVAVLSIDANDTVTDTGTRIDIPGGTPNTFFGVPGLAVTPDGTRLFISSYDSDVVSILDTATDTVSATIAVGDGPAGIGMPPQ